MTEQNKTPKKKKRIFIILAIVIFIAVIIFFNLQAQREKGLKATVQKVKKTDLTSIISASGEISPKKNVDISAHVPGRIVKIGVEEGQRVQKGDFLLKLDSIQYEANAIGTKPKFVVLRQNSLKRKPA